MTWLVITASVLVAGSAQNYEARNPIKEFPSLAACEERLREHTDSGLYDGDVVKQVFDAMARSKIEFGKHVNELHIRLHCEEPD